MDLQSGWNSSWCYPLRRSSLLNTFALFSSDISSSIVGRVFRSLRTALFPNKKRTIVFLVGLPHINTWANIISVLLRLCTIPMMWAHHQPSRWCLSLLDSLAPFPLNFSKGMESSVVSVLLDSQCGFSPDVLSIFLCLETDLGTRFRLCHFVVQPCFSLFIMSISLAFWYPSNGPLFPSQQRMLPP